MGIDGIGDKIRASTEQAGKSYVFNHAHNEDTPAQMWFQESDEGLILFVVFYTLACRWSRCLGCNLPSKMSLKPVSYKSIMAQVDHVFRDWEVETRLADIRKVIVSNNGSVLDQITFSSTALMYLLAKLNLHVPNLAVLTIETRPEYVEPAELEFVARALAEGETPTALELAIGFEAFNDHIRNDVYDKGLQLESFERFAGRVAQYRYRIKCYFMQKPVPGMSDEEAVRDIQDGIDYLSKVAADKGVSINMHLCPTYVAVGTPLEEAFRKGEYTPPALHDVARAAMHARNKPISVYIATSDEGLAAQGGSFLDHADEQVVQGIEQFNRSQDYDILETITKGATSGPG